MSATICVDVLGRPGQDVGRRHPERRGVGQERAELALGERRRSVSPAAAAPRMILSSISVMFITQVTA